MRTLLIMTLAAAGLALMLLSANGLSPDPSVWAIFALGSMMLVLTTEPLTTGRLRHKSGRVAQ